MSSPISPQERFLDAWITLGLVILAALLYIPMLGTYPLWDPWEAHYSQVAMEMVWKDSWWTPWFQGGTTGFWSKPIFTFWLMVGSLKTFRVHQLQGFVDAEFYLRLPIAIIGAVGIGFMFFICRKLWNRHMAILTSLVLMTSPQYFLISRQVMVDIPYVVVQMIAMGFLALGIFSKEAASTSEESHAASRTYLLYAAGFAAIQMIEVLFWSQRLKQTFQVSWSQSNLLWMALALFFVVWAIVRRFVPTPQTRYFYLFYFFSGLGFLAKGLLSIVLPGGVLFFYILLTGDWNLLRRMRLVYVSDRIKFSTSIALGVLSSAFAVWFITYSMFRGQGLSGLVREIFGAASTRRISIGWIEQTARYLDTNVIYPLFKLSFQTQLTLHIGIFLALLGVAYAIGSAKAAKESDPSAAMAVTTEHLRAFLFPGILVYLVVAGSWIYVMNVQHGLPFMREWFIYHHFSRLAGTIEKPNDTFDLYIRQIAFGMFPWSAFILVGLLRFLRWTWRDFQSDLGRRNFFFFCCFLFPYFFYTFSSTKFHHYIFPVVPFLAIIVGAWLVRLFREDGILKERLAVGFSFLIFVLLAKDLTTNYRPLHQLFTYYTTREVPPEVFPKTFFTLVFGLFGLIFLLAFLSRRFRTFHFGLLMVPVALFVLFVNVRLIPAVAVNFSFKAVYKKYVELDKGKGNPFGEYSNWDERSTDFYSQNKRKYLGTEQQTTMFLRTYPVSYIMVAKQQIPHLRMLASKVGKTLYIVGKPHYEMWLVSTQPGPDARTRDQIVTRVSPRIEGKHWKKVDINFNNEVKMIGVWQSKPEGYKRGEEVELRFVYQVLKTPSRNWRVFIHADPVKWTRHRLNWDHEMAEGLHPTTEWKPGEYVSDVVKQRIPLNFPDYYHHLSIYTGLWLGADRLPVLSSIGASHDGQNRILPITITIKP